MGISRCNDWGNEAEKKKEGMLGDGELTMMVIQEEEKRENEGRGVICYMNEREWLIRA